MDRQPQHNERDMLSLKIEEYRTMPVETTMFHDLVQSTKDEDTQNILYGTIGLRRLIEASPQFATKLIDEQLQQIFFSNAMQEQNPMLQKQSVLTLLAIICNVPSEIVNTETMGSLLTYLTQSARSFEDMRDMIAQANPFPRLLSYSVQVIENPIRIKLALLLCVLFHSQRPINDEEVVCKSLEVMCQALLQTKDNEEIIQICQTISQLSVSEDRVKTIYNSGFVPQLIHILGEKHQGLLTAALRILGTIASQSIDLTQFIKHGALNKILLLLNHKRHAIRRQALWMLSNMLVNEQIISEVMENYALMEKITKLLENDTVEVRKQAFYCISNIVEHSHLTLQGVYQLFFASNLIQNLISGFYDEIVPAQMMMQTFLNIFLLGEKYKMNGKNAVFQKFKEIGGDALLQSLESHPCEKVVNYLNIIKAKVIS